ncbi:hypothetical protein ACFLIM_42565 [Nonomuraea sp. M3C6]|uniref:Uncharacterized protein n=1 Tax=Nonomuraea marmarensis TaxID=3351344 RepID=A0ABW7AUZ0_9ACTN
MEGTHEGLAAARARGVRLGRPPVMRADLVDHAGRVHPWDVGQRDLLARR